MTQLFKTALVAFLMMLSALSPSLAQMCEDEPPPPPPRAEKPVT